MKKRLLAVFLIISMVSLLVMGCGNTSGKQESSSVAELPEEESNEDNMSATKSSQEKGSNHVVLAYYGGTCEAPIFVAKEKGFFEEEGLDVELVLVAQDTAMLVSTNKIDAVMVTPNIFPGAAEGLDIKIIEAAHTGCIQGATTKDSGIKSAADLKGKRVGIAAEGDVPQLQLSEEMRQAGLDPRKDVEWIIYPDPQLELALEQGEIDAFASWDPFTTMALENGYELFFSTTTGDFFKNDICCFYGMNPNTLEKNPELGKKLAKAFAKSNEFIMSNPHEAAELIIDNEYTVGDVDMTAGLLGDYEWVSNDKARIEESMRKIFGWCQRGGAISESADVDSFVANILEYCGD